MRKFSINLTKFFCGIMLSVGSGSLVAQGPVIGPLSLNGELAASDLFPGTTATVEWAPGVTGPWSDNWAGLTDVLADMDGAILVDVPMFFRLRVANPDPARLVWVPPGTFLMGSPPDEAERWPDETQHAVTLTRGFWMGKYPVTQQEYEDVTGRSFTGGPTLPAVNVSWSDATSYCSQLTTRDRASGRLAEGYAYRLPTEAEREYACRAGTTTAFHYGAALTSGMANFYGKREYVASIGSYDNAIGVYPERTTEVGLYSPNAWGLYDMHGNVWEWCRDWAGDYPGGPETDPTGPATGTSRVIRGADWGNIAGVCRSAERFEVTPDSAFASLGFRVVLAATQQ